MIDWDRIRTDLRAIRDGAASLENVLIGEGFAEQGSPWKPGCVSAPTHILVLCEGQVDANNDALCSTHTAYRARYYPDHRGWVLENRVLLKGRPIRWRMLTAWEERECAK